MELKIHVKNKTKTIKLNDSILSIQTSDKKVIDKLIKDYDAVVIDNSNDFFVSKTVLDEIGNYRKYPELSIVSDVIKLLDLDNNFFDRNIDTLSMTERFYLNLLRNVSCITDIILFKDIFIGLDNNVRKKMIKIINYLKDKGYLVIICSSDVNYLYELADYSLICTEYSIKFGKTDEIYTDVQLLKKYKLDIPILPYITFKAKEEKNIKLFYSKDVRDIIKDIYKHV